MSPTSHSSRDDPEGSAPDSPRAPELRTLALERAVRWEPVEHVLSSFSVPLGTISAVEPLVVHQQALQDIEAHAAASRAFAFGVLYGEIYRCPRLHMNYLLVEGVHRGSLDDAPPNADLRSALAAVLERLRASGVRSVGWYRAGATVGLHLSSADTSMHSELFPQPWAVAFVRDALIVRATAAFMRLIDRTRPYAVPFYEQLPADAYREGDRIRTAISWSSYHTMTDVLPPEVHNAPLPLFDARKIRRAPVGRPAGAGRSQTARVKPFEPAKAAPATPAPVPAPAPGLAPALESTPALEVTPAEPLSPAPPPPASQSIERIFEPDLRAFARHPPVVSPRRRLFQKFSFRPRAGILALTIVAITLAILAAWQLTH